MAPIKKRAIQRAKAKKRKGFFGRRPQDVPIESTESEEISTEPIPSTSTPRSDGHDKKITVAYSSITDKKLANSSFEELLPGGVLTRSCRKALGFSPKKVARKTEEAQGYSIVEMSLIQSALKFAAICSTCKSSNSEIRILKDNSMRHGLAERFIFKCSLCHHETKTFSSAKIDNGKFEVNRRSVVASNAMKGGRKVLSDFCGMMNLPPPLAPASYARHLKFVSQVTKQEVELLMIRAAQRIRKSILKKNPNADKTDIDGAIPVAVSIDGTWQKRGFTSKYGIVTAILVDTGEVVDFEVLSLHCYECRKHQHDDNGSEKYKQWQEKHSEVCEINYKGSSSGMEGDGALKIFKRSISERNLKYTTFVGDGDSDTYKIVRNGIAEIYGDRYKVIKEECIGHIQKRMGNALRTYKKNRRGEKLSDGKTAGGKGRLTEETINCIQRYYGNAIRKNTGDLHGMQNALWAIFHHLVKPASDASLQEQHKFCPKGKSSWCKFNSDIETGCNAYDDSQRLPAAFYFELKPIFERLTSPGLLERCQQGLTQNANESLHHLIWLHCPKNMFCSKAQIESGVSEAVSCFNTGAGTKAVILRAAGIQDVGRSTMISLRAADKLRTKAAIQKITKKYKSWRWSKKLTKKKEIASSREHYQSGGFTSEGEKTVPKKRKMKQKSKRAKKHKLESRQNESFAIIASSSDDVTIIMPEPLAYILPFSST